MKGGEFITTKMRLIEIGKLVDSLDLDGFLACIKNAETAGAALNPEQYQKAALSLDADRRLCESLQPVKTVWGDTYKALMNPAGAGFVKKTGKDQ